MRWAHVSQHPREGVPRSEAPVGGWLGGTLLYEVTLQTPLLLVREWWLQGSALLRGHGPRLGCSRTALPPPPPALLWVPPAGPWPGDHPPGDSQPDNNQPDDNQQPDNNQPDNNPPDNNQQPENPEPKPSVR